MNLQSTERSSNSTEPIRKELGAIGKSRRYIGKLMGSTTPTGQVTITFANWLTLIRLAIVPLFWFTFMSGNLKLEIAATLLCVLGGLTDFWDGKIARRTGQVTPFGVFMDPLADKLLVLSIFWAILIREDFGSLLTLATIMICIISLREIGLTILRILAIGKGSTLITSYWGKLKTMVQSFTLLIILLAVNVRGILSSQQMSIAVLEGQIFIILVNTLLLASMLISLFSGWLYVYERFHPGSGRD